MIDTSSLLIYFAIWWFSFGPGAKIFDKLTPQNQERGSHRMSKKLKKLKTLRHPYARKSILILPLCRFTFQFDNFLCGPGAKIFDKLKRQNLEAFESWRQQVHPQAHIEAHRKPESVSPAFIPPFININNINKNKQQQQRRRNVPAGNVTP